MLLAWKLTVGQARVADKTVYRLDVEICNVCVTCNIRTFYSPLYLYIQWNDNKADLTKRIEVKYNVKTTKSVKTDLCITLSSFVSH